MLQQTCCVLFLFHVTLFLFFLSISRQLVPKLTRNFMKEGFMEKTGPKVCAHESVKSRLHWAEIKQAVGSAPLLYVSDRGKHEALYIKTVCENGDKLG